MFGGGKQAAFTTPKQIILRLGAGNPNFATLDPGSQKSLYHQLRYNLLELLVKEVLIGLGQPGPKRKIIISLSQFFPFHFRKISV
jgi:hypothetical protein